MKKDNINKKPWSRPVVFILNIKKDTFGGSGTGPEGGGKKGPPNPPV